MLAVILDGKGTASINWSWLPTWIGMNANLVRDLDEVIRPLLTGKPATFENLRFAHGKVIEYLEARFALPGLVDYLDGLKFLPEVLDEVRSSKS